MEEFKSCPICFEVPENEIYQCSAGHIICGSCILRVNRCSQCRVYFGTNKIRNRALEKILDSQVFDCKFKDNGCPVLCKRKELTSHANSCLFNADTVPLCEQMGFKRCKFRMGCVSKLELISHYREVHNCAFQPHFHSMSPLKVNGFELMTCLAQRRKLDASETQKVVLFGLISSSDLETAPLFLVLAKGENSSGFLSLVCVKIWESSSQPPTITTAEFTLFKDPQVCSTQGKLSSTSPLKTGNFPFPLGGIVNVGGVKEAHHLFKAKPIDIPISLLEESRFGSYLGDVMKVEIKEKIAVGAGRIGRSDIAHFYSQNRQTSQVYYHRV